MNILIVDIKTIDEPMPRMSRPTGDYERVKITEFYYIIYDMLNDVIIEEGDGIPDLNKDIYGIAGYHVDSVVKVLLNHFPELYNFIKDKVFLCTMRSGCRTFGTSNAFMTREKLCELLGVQESKHQTLDCLTRLLDRNDGLLKYEKLKIKKPN
jgi:hypothetical protein